MTTETLGHAVDILITRMADYPEEFTGHAIGSTRFAKHARMVRESYTAAATMKGTDPLMWMPEAERTRLHDAYRTILREDFVLGVMAELVAPEPDPQPMLDVAKQAMNAVLTNPYPGATGAQAALQQQHNGAYTEMTRAKSQAEMARMQMDAMKLGTGFGILGQI